MPITIRINELTLCHKGSSGFSAATLPDVCLTPAPPGPPVPVPYPNLAFSKDLVNGTTTVSADGGNMIAIQGSQFMISTGDEPGVAGGVMSAVNMKETNWMTYSMDVFMDGKNVCRLTDKQFHNHYNTVNAGGSPPGETEAPLTPAMTKEIDFICQQICWCLANAETSGRGLEMQECVNNLLKYNRDLATRPGNEGNPNYPNNVLPTTGFAPAGPPWAPGTWTATGGASGGSGGRAPDAVISNQPIKPGEPLPPGAKVVEIKFKKDRYSCDQQKADIGIAGGKENVILLTPKTCGCPGTEDDPDPAIDKCEEDAQDEQQSAQQATPYTTGELVTLGVIAAVLGIAVIAVAWPVIFGEGVVAAGAGAGTAGAGAAGAGAAGAGGAGAAGAGAAGAGAAGAGVGVASGTFPAGTAAGAGLAGAGAGAGGGAGAAAAGGGVAAAAGGAAVLSSSGSSSPPSGPGPNYNSSAGVPAPASVPGGS